MAIRPQQNFPIYGYSNPVHLWTGSWSVGFVDHWIIYQYHHYKFAWFFFKFTLIKLKLASWEQEQSTSVSVLCSRENLSQKNPEISRRMYYFNAFKSLWKSLKYKVTTSTHCANFNSYVWNIMNIIFICESWGFTITFK